MTIFTSSLNINLPAIPVTDDMELFQELLKVYSAIQAIHQNITKSTRVVCVFDEVVLAGQALNIFNVSGVLKARLASASDNTKPAVGFCSSDVPYNQANEVILSGYNKYLKSLIPAKLYYLSVTSGLYTSVKPVIAGQIVQPVGYAISTTELIFNASNTWTQL